MICRAFFGNRWFSLLLIVVFMLFASPTSSLETNPPEAGKSSASIGIDYFAEKSTPRILISTLDEKLKLSKSASFFSWLSCFIYAMMGLLCLTLRNTYISFSPLISILLARRFLLPIRSFSNYV
jgi:hypothetical protein